MNKKLRPTWSTQKIKDEQINFFLEDVEKNLDEYKRAIDTKDKQLSAKKKLQGEKKGYDSAIKEKQELKMYIENITQRYQQYQQRQQQ